VTELGMPAHGTQLRTRRHAEPPARFDRYHAAATISKGVPMSRIRFARGRAAALLAAPTLLLAASPSGAASELVFDATAAGGVVAVGNRLGLAKQSNANGPGTAGSIGTFGGSTRRTQRASSSG
jgi:hypothetical protein